MLFDDRHHCRLCGIPRFGVEFRECGLRLRPVGRELGGIARFAVSFEQLTSIFVAKFSSGYTAFALAALRQHQHNGRAFQASSPKL
jgi:hypothetical protein